MRSKFIFPAIILLISGIASAQEIPVPAGKIMDEAYKVAASEGKSVMIVFHASWCGWCKKFEASISDPSCKEFFDKHFVIKYLDILERADRKNLENPDAIDVYDKFGGQGGGIPFFLIFDNNRTLLADSKIRASSDGADKQVQNMGCPASDEEVTAFIQILEKVTKVSDAEKTAITERFKKNRI